MMALQPGETHTKKAHQDKTAAWVHVGRRD